MSQKELSDDDLKHIERLQSLRDSGIVNMYTEVQSGLHQVFGDDDGEETYQWILDNFEYYKSGDWTEVET